MHIDLEQGKADEARQTAATLRPYVVRGQLGRLAAR